MTQLSRTKPNQTKQVSAYPSSVLLTLDTPTGDGRRKERKRARVERREVRKKLFFLYRFLPFQCLQYIGKDLLWNRSMTKNKKH